MWGKRKREIEVVKLYCKNKTLVLLGGVEFPNLDIPLENIVFDRVRVDACAFRTFHDRNQIIDENSRSCIRAKDLFRHTNKKKVDKKVMHIIVTYLFGLPPLDGWILIKLLH